MKQSYVIGTLSRFTDHLVELCQSVRQSGETAEIVIADDGIDSTAIDLFMPAKTIKCSRPFNFSRNANAILKSTKLDVFLINDDAKMTGSDCPISLLRDTAKDKSIGVVSAVVRGRIGNSLQKLRHKDIVDIGNTTMCFVAIYLSRRVIDKVGFLDESFDGYGFEDADYSTRCRKAGLKNVVDTRCLVEHQIASSSYKRVMDIREQRIAYQKSLKTYRQKWNNP